MIKTSNLEELENLLTDVLNCSKADLNDENGPGDISNWDSITHMDMISKIEEKFSVQFDVDEINQIDTIGSIKGALKKHGLKL